MSIENYKEHLTEHLTAVVDDIEMYKINASESKREWERYENIISVLEEEQANIEIAIKNSKRHISSEFKISERECTRFVIALMAFKDKTNGQDSNIDMKLITVESEIGNSIFVIFPDGSEVDLTDLSRW